MLIGELMVFESLGSQLRTERKNHYFLLSFQGTAALTGGQKTASIMKPEIDGAPALV
jgi:hypothetical protein